LGRSINCSRKIPWTSRCCHQSPFATASCSSALTSTSGVSARRTNNSGSVRLPRMLLRTEHLTKDYGRFRALNDLQLSVAPGEVFGLLGPNGSGKTTALRLLLGFLRPTAGSAWIAHHDCWHDGVAARRHVAYLPGELRLYENMTGRQLVRFL